MALQIVGQYKGSIQLDLNTCTVLNLKEAVSRASGLAVAGLKLLAGGKHLKDDASVLAQCGVKPGQKIIVLRQDLSGQVDTEKGLNRRTEEVAQAASLLSARAARDIDAQGRGGAWGDWGRNPGRGRGRGGEGSGRRGDGPRIELTNQDGEAVAIPAEDSAALMEGIMLHRKGLACLGTLTKRSAPKTAAPAREGTAGAQANPPQSGSSSSLASLTDDEGLGNEVEVDDVPKDHKETTVGGCEERKETVPDGMQVDGSQVDADRSAEMEVTAPAAPALGAEAGGEHIPQPPGVGAQRTGSLKKSKGKLRAGVSTQRRGAGAAPSASEKRLVQREALGLLLRADEAFRRCKPVYLDRVDNYAYLCLDIVWLLFLMKDMSNLELASRMLEAVDVGFKNAHGPGLQRLTSLKGEFCAEKLLYVRLHLLQGVVAFLKGDSGTASTLLIRASEEAKALRPDPALAARLALQWRSVTFEPLQQKVALQALRAGRNDLDAAWQYLEGLRQRKKLVLKEERRRAQDRLAQRYGRTANRQGFVDAALVDQLTAGGFAREKVARALREHNNDVGAALAALTSRTAGGDPVTDESVAVLESLGIPQDAARDVLRRTGSLCDALSELGVSAPEGVDVGPSVRDGVDRKDSKETGSLGGLGSGADGGEPGESGEEDVGDEKAPGPTAEEMRLYDELVEDRQREGEEGHLNVTLEDEADAADMYLHLCRGNIPLAFDLAKVRAGIAEAAAARGK